MGLAQDQDLDDDEEQAVDDEKLNPPGSPVSNPDIASRSAFVNQLRNRLGGMAASRDDASVNSALNNQLMKSAAQIGSFHGHVADTSSLDEFRKEMESANQARYNSQANLFGVESKGLSNAVNMNRKQHNFETSEAGKDRRADVIAGNRNLFQEKHAKDLQDKLDAANDKTTNSDFIKMEESIDPNKSRTGQMGKNQARVDQAERLQGLIQDSGGNVNNLDSRQMEELAIGLNSMLSNSSAGSTTQTQALLPKTAIGSAESLKEWLMNEPQGRNQIAFIKRMSDTVSREKDIASGQVKKAQVARLSAYEHLKKKNPDRYRTITHQFGVSDEDLAGNSDDAANNPKDSAPAPTPSPVDGTIQTSNQLPIDQHKVGDIVTRGGKQYRIINDNLDVEEVQ